MKYRKKPVEIDAVLWDGSIDGADKIEKWSKGATKCQLVNNDFNVAIIIETLEGNMTAIPGDYIIKGVAGEFYPCKPKIFEATYEPVFEEI